MSSFDEILNNNNTSNHEPTREEVLLQQALKRREYNRTYQAKLRAVSRFVALNKKIDDNLDHVIHYIKTNYSDEYDAYVGASDEVAVGYPEAFVNWLTLCQGDYKDIKEAYNMSTLGDMGIDYDQFKIYFKEILTRDNRGRWIKH